MSGPDERPSCWPPRSPNETGRDRNRVPIRDRAVPRRIRGESGDRPDQPAERRRAETRVRAAAAVPEGGARASHAGAERGDAGAHRADRRGSAPTGSASLGGSAPRRCRIRAGHGQRRGPAARRLRDRARHAASASWSAGRAARPSRLRRSWPAGTSAAGCPTPGRSACRSAIPRCAPPGRRSGPGCWCCSPSRPAGWPRPPGSPTTWPARAQASAARAPTGCPPLPTRLSSSPSAGRTAGRSAGPSSFWPWSPARRVPPAGRDGGVRRQRLADVRRRTAPAQPGGAVRPGAAQAALPARLPGHRWRARR